MSVFRRKTSAGLTEEYHYRFKSKGKIYVGVCENCHNKEMAEKYEKEFRNKVFALKSQKTLKGLVENYRDILSGEIKLPLEDVYPKYKDMIEGGKEQKNLVLIRWNNFKEFINKNYPDIEYINQIRDNHALEYRTSLTANGISITRKAKRGKSKKDVFKKVQSHISNETKNKYLGTIKSIFKKMSITTKMTANPFANIESFDRNAIEREAFTLEELKKIGEASKGTLLYPLFLTALCTGLREGDICTLQWKELDYTIGSNGFIKKKTGKTGKVVEIPILDPLRNYLDEQTKEGKYCFPELANLYLNHRKSIGSRVTTFLKKIKIEKMQPRENRARKTSVKDIHSCRHTFAYLAAKHGVPFPVVQKILGHVTDKMTESYMNHATLEERESSMKMIPDYLNGKNEISTTLTDKDLIVKIKAVLESHKSSPLKKELTQLFK
ncbi:MAG: tyrosine-type recombinase/integrase [Victivallales bacterium]